MIKQKGKIYLLFMIIIGAAILAFILIKTFIRTKPPVEEVGSIYKHFYGENLTNADGSRFALSTDKCTAYLYWASWCPDCESILPDIESLENMVRDRDYSFQMIDRLEKNRESVDKAEQALKDKGLTQKSAFDENRVDYDSIGLTMIPTVFVTNTSGCVTSVSRGTLPDASKLISMLDEADTGKSTSIYNRLKNLDEADAGKATSISQCYSEAQKDTFLPDLIYLYGSGREKKLMNSLASYNQQPFAYMYNENDDGLILSSIYLKQIRDNPENGRETDTTDITENYTDIFDIVQKSYISDSVPLFYTTYKRKLSSYKKTSLDTLEELSIMLSLSSVDALPQKSYLWLKDRVRAGTLWEAYDITGSAVSDDDIAYPDQMRYAVAALIAISEKDMDTASVAIERMEVCKNYSPESDNEYLIENAENGGYDLFLQYLALYVYESYEKHL